MLDSDLAEIYGYDRHPSMKVDKRYYCFVFININHKVEHAKIYWDRCIVIKIYKKGI